MTKTVRESARILHVMFPEKFVPSFIELVGLHFPPEDHAFFLFGSKSLFGEISVNKVYYAEEFPSKMSAYAQLSKSIRGAQKVILHGLFDIRLVQFLLTQLWQLKKCHWVIWGGDLYRCRYARRTLRWHFEEACRRPVIRRMGCLISYLEDDVELARKYYKATGLHKPCIMYLSNTWSQIEASPSKHECINIQIGNSASRENRHSDVLQRLARYKDCNIRIFVPLSYGDRAYAKEVAQLGEEIFGSKFEPMFDFLDFNKYLQFLSMVDTAVFNHRRQEGMGNVIKLLGLGKKVFLREETSSYTMLRNNGVVVFDTANLDISALSDADRQNNIERIKTLFSKQTLIDQWGKIFGGDHGISV